MYNNQNLPLSPQKIIKKTLFLSTPAIAVALLFFLVSFLPVWLNSFIIANSVDGIIDSTYLTMLGSLQTLTRFFALISLSFIPLILIYEYFYYKTYFYDFSPDKAKISKGVLRRSTGFVTYDKIQSIYLNQDPLDKFFGLYDVHFETAATESGSYSHVDGLNKENAEKLVDFLQENTKLVSQG